jgi:cell division inhibitor SepF
VIRPKSMEDALEIAKTLVARCVVILNLEGLDLDVSQRLFDFASGCTCALQGRLDKISNYIFVLTPKDIQITGEFQEILTGTFDPDDLGDDEDF